MTDEVQRGFGKDKVSVTASDATTDISISLTVEKDLFLAQSEFDEALSQINTEWNTLTTINGHTYRVKTTLTPVDGGGDLVIRDWSGAPRGYVHNAGLNRGREIFVNKGFTRVGNQLFSNSRPTTPAHEFGHALGLGHQKNKSESIMSYNTTRSLRNGTDLMRLANVYSK